MTVTPMFKASRGEAPSEAVHSPPGVLVLPAEAAATSGEAGETHRATESGDLPPGERQGEGQAAADKLAGTDIATLGARNLPVKWQPASSKLILVTKSRGGAGATSVAVNLGLELQGSRGLFRRSSRRRVALLDFDVQFGNVGNLLDLEDRGGMLALMRLAEEPDAQAVRNALLTHASGLKVMVAPRMAVPLEALDIHRVRSIISALEFEYDYIVVDLPPALVSWLEPLLVRAERLLMVSDLAVPSIACARRILDLMREDNPEIPAEVVVSREAKPVIKRKVHREASAALGLPLRHWLPNEPKLSRLALDRGEPLSTLAPRSPWTKSLRQIAMSIEAARFKENRA